MLIISLKYPVPPTPNTFCGKLLSAVLFSPNCPFAPSPHDHTLPFESNAIEYQLPNDNCIILFNTPFPELSFTCFILLYVLVFPTPPSPWQLCPTVHTLPSSFNIPDTQYPAAISFTPVTFPNPL